MSDEGGLRWRLGLVDDDFRDKLVNAGNAVEGMNRKFEAIGRGLAGGAMMEWVKSTLDAADAIQATAENLGITTTALQAFQAKVREANGTNEDANRIFTTARSKLDELAAGSASAIDAFGQLGLKAEDFVGLSLDQSLEKIARAYSENSNRAGALAALQDIVGRSGRNLTAVLVELGEQGFGTVIRDAEAAHAVISEKTINDLAETKKRWEEIGNVMKTGSAEIIGSIVKVVQSAVHIYTNAIEQVWAVLTGKLFSANGRAEMHQTMEMTGTEIRKIWGLTEQTAAAAEKQKKAVDETLPPLRDSRQLTEERAKHEEIVAKMMADGADAATRLKIIQQQIADHTEKAAAAGSDKVTAQKEMNKAAELELEMRKLQREEQARQLEFQIKVLEAQRAQLPLWEQGKILAKEVALITDEIARKKTQHLDTAKEENELLGINSRIQELQKARSNELLKAAGDLLSNDRIRNEEGRIRLQLLSGEITKLEVQREAEVLLARGVENLNEQEKIRLNGLVENLTLQQRELEITRLLANGVQNLTDADKSRLAVLQGQTAELEKQRNLTPTQRQQSALVDLYAKRGLAGPKRDPQKLTDRELEEHIQQLRNFLYEAQEDQLIQGYEDSFYKLTKMDLEKAEAEKSTRFQFRKQADFLGVSKALELHSPFEEQRFRGYVNVIDQTAVGEISDGIKELNRRLNPVFPK